MGAGGGGDCARRFAGRVFHCVSGFYRKVTGVELGTWGESREGFLRMHQRRFLR